MPGYQVEQVKEKFGGPRYYVSIPYDGPEVDEETADRFAVLIEAAEDRSFSVCELCGDVGEIRADRGLVKTLCAACRPASA